jgi:hypothetical protein
MADSSTDGSADSTETHDTTEYPDADDILDSAGELPPEYRIAAFAAMVVILLGTIAIAFLAFGSLF